MSINFDIRQFSEAIDQKKKQFQEATRPAAQAGAQVIYDQARLNVPVSKKGHFFYGTSFKINGKKYYFESGSLKKSIFQRYQKEKSSPNIAIYNITYDTDIAPYGHMVELGTSKSSAVPFMSNAIKSHGDDAQAAMMKRFQELIK